mmetsp:Transcript_115528/g.326568  ORF Transcript_115528/g.326568 Transcript_115528/m.326568 type:complete len:231 (-) Transcript_115528:2-694(-)
MVVSPSMFANFVRYDFDAGPCYAESMDSGIEPHDASMTPIVICSPALPLPHTAAIGDVAVQSAVASAAARPSRRRPRMRREPESEPEVNDPECALAPLLKRLRLQDGLTDLGGGDSMAVDCGCDRGQKPLDGDDVCHVAGAVGIEADGAAQARSRDPGGGDGVPCTQSTNVRIGEAQSSQCGDARNGGAAEAWRAEVLRRARDEFWRYRQEVRSREAGTVVRPCFESSAL